MVKKYIVSDDERNMFQRAVDKIKKTSPGEYAKPSNNQQAKRTNFSDYTPKIFKRDDNIQYKAEGIQDRRFKKLKQGEYSLEARLDLHGYTRVEASDALSLFLATSIHENKQCVLIIHGKSGDEYPIIKNCVYAWLKESPDVLSFCSAKAKDGGTGAVYVLLKKYH